MDAGHPSIYGVIILYRRLSNIPNHEKRGAVLYLPHPGYACDWRILGHVFTLTRSLDQFPPDNFIRIGKTIIANVAWPMRILMPLTWLMLLWLSWISFRQRPSFYFFLGSLILMVISLVITVGVEVSSTIKSKRGQRKHYPLTGWIFDCDGINSISYRR